MEESELLYESEKHEVSASNEDYSDSNFFNSSGMDNVTLGILSPQNSVYSVEEIEIYKSFGLQPDRDVHGQFTEIFLNFVTSCRQISVYTFSFFSNIINENAYNYKNSKSFGRSLIILPLNSSREYRFNNEEIESVCASKSFARILNSQIPKCLEEEKNGSLMKCASRVISNLCSDNASWKTSPFSIDLGHNFTSCPNFDKKEDNPLCTFSSNKNFILGGAEFETSFCELCGEPQSCSDVLFVEGRICFKDFFGSSSVFKHFQDYGNHDSSAFESRLSMTDIGVNNNTIINFNSHKDNNSNEVYKDYEFKSMPVTEVYSLINNGEDVYFLNAEGREVKVNSISKIDNYSGKIYDVDIANDVVLVRMNKVVCDDVSNEEENYEVNTNKNKLINENGDSKGIEIVGKELIINDNKLADNKENNNYNINEKGKIINDKDSNELIDKSLKNKERAGRMVKADGQQFSYTIYYLNSSKYLTVSVGSENGARVAEWLTRPAQDRLPPQGNEGSTPNSSSDFLINVKNTKVKTLAPGAPSSDENKLIDNKRNINENRNDGDLIINENQIINPEKIKERGNQRKRRKNE